MNVINCATCGKEIKEYKSLKRKHCSLKCRDWRNPKQRLYDKFKVDESTGCWNWTAGLDRDGYSVFEFRPFAQRGHRASWIIHNGSIPDGMLVCHKCDNRKCINPDHLFLGTSSDNNQDMMNKMRNIYHCGSKSVLSKLTEEKVIEMRDRYAKGGITQRKLALEYGIGYKAVCKIINRQRWTHV
jgi:hypothetical protein